jgi:hypothetical protein
VEGRRLGEIVDAAVLWFFGILYTAAVLVLRRLRRAPDSDA